MKRPFLAPVLAVTALASAQAAHAQKACVAPEDAADAVIYAMPAAYEATVKKCGEEFAGESFLQSADGLNFIQQFRTQQDKRWDGTSRFLKVFIAAQAEGDNQGAGEMIASMPAESLRPFVDGIMGQLIAEQIKTDSCGKIDRGAELLSPLPADNVSGLVAFIVELVDLDNPPVCKTGGTVTVGSEAMDSE